MDSILARSDGLKLNAQMMDLFPTNIQLFESCRLVVDYCDVFISCLDSHSDGTHSLDPLVSKWCNNKLISENFNELITFLAVFNIWVNYSFNCSLKAHQIKFCVF